MSSEAEYLKWRRQHSIGCVFARLIATNTGRFEQRIETLPAANTPLLAAQKIEQLVVAAIADAKTTSFALMLPHLGTLEEVAIVMWSLREIPGWAVTSNFILPPPVGDFVALNITRDIPFQGGTRPSEALVLGPYPDIFPPTRCAPVSAFEIYVGPPRPNGPLDDKPIDKANLAHIELNLPNHATFQMMWDNSKKGRLLSLGGPDNRAKAKVSLTIPLALAQQVGCAP